PRILKVGGWHDSGMTTAHLSAAISALDLATRAAVLVGALASRAPSTTDCESCGAEYAPKRWPFRGDCEHARLCIECHRSITGPLLERIVRDRRFALMTRDVFQEKLN